MIQLKKKKVMEHKKIDKERLCSDHKRELESMLRDGDVYINRTL